jgi:hypothetical protein
MDQATMERLQEKGFKLCWSEQREGVGYILRGVWFILVMDPQGGYWSVAPVRQVGPDGKRNGPEGCLLAEEKPEELARVLLEAGCTDVRIFRLEEKAHLSIQR